MCAGGLCRLVGWRGFPLSFLFFFFGEGRLFVGCGLFGLCYHFGFLLSRVFFFFFFVSVWFVYWWVIW